MSTILTEELSNDFLNLIQAKLLTSSFYIPKNTRQNLVHSAFIWFYCRIKHNFGFLM